MVAEAELERLLGALRVGESQGYWLGEEDFVSTADRQAASLGPLGFPREWPAAYTGSDALKSLLGKEGRCAGKRVRVVHPPTDKQRAAVQALALRPLQSFGNAERVEQTLGLRVVKGWVVYEHLDRPLSSAYVAERYWWNATPEGAWMDFTPRPEPWSQLLLAEAADDQPPRQWTPLSAAEAALSTQLLRQRFGAGGTGCQVVSSASTALASASSGQPPRAAPGAAAGVGRQGLLQSWAERLVGMARASGSSQDAVQQCAAALGSFGAEMRQADTDERYFRSYALTAQQGMLSDAPRTEAFQRALTKVCAGGGVVLDVGCGSGVLSMFAAKAGADHVIAIEANRVSAKTARALVEDNGLSHKITILEGRVEELVDSVDAELRRHGGKLRVLVSEFIGFCIIHEGMFTSVAFARDRWHPEEIIPRSGDVLICPFFIEAYPERAIEFWMQEHYGLRFSAAAKTALRSATESVLSEQLDPDNLLAEGQSVWHLDCMTASAEEAARMNPMSVSFEVTSRGPLHGLCVYFTLELCSGVTLPCGPEDPPTHWKQMMALLHAQEGAMPFPVMWPGDSIDIRFGFHLVRGRFLEVTAAGKAKSRGGSKPPWTFDQTWFVTPDPVIEPAE